MTVKNAIEILDIYSKQKNELKDGLREPSKSWNNCSELTKNVAEMIADAIDTDIMVLEAIKRQIQPKCAHPKKLRDIDPDGNPYCMDCNLDL